MRIFPSAFPSPEIRNYYSYFPGYQIKNRWLHWGTNLMKPSFLRILWGGGLSWAASFLIGFAWLVVRLRDWSLDLMTSLITPGKRVRAFIILCPEAGVSRIVEALLSSVVPFHYSLPQMWLWRSSAALLRFSFNSALSCSVRSLTIWSFETTFFGSNGAFFISFLIFWWEAWGGGRQPSPLGGGTMLI